MRWLVYTLLIVLLFQAAYASPLRPVRVQFNWAHQFEYAGFYMALEKGFYREAGLAVSLYSLKERGHSPLQALAQQEVEFIVSNTPAMVEALNGAPWVMVANYFKRSALVWLVQPDIATPSALQGLPVSITPGKQAGSVLTALLNIYGVQPQWRQMAPNEMLPAFERGELAAMPAYMSNEPVRLTLKNRPYRLIEPWRFGLEGLGDSVFTHRAFAQQHPEVVAAFVQATNRGWEYALTHPDEAVALILDKYNEQQKSPEALKMEAGLTSMMIMPGLYPLGSMPEPLLRRVGETLLVSGQVESLKGLSALRWQPKEPLSSSEVVFCNDPNWVPVDYVDELGQPRGIAPDYVQSLFQRFLPHYALKHHATRTWAETLAAFHAGRCDLLVEAIKTPARSETMLFTRPYLQYPFLVITRSDHPYVERMEQLYGKRVARQRGSALIELLRHQHPQVAIVETENTDQAFIAVAKGDADAVLAIGPVAQHSLLRLGLDTLVINGVLPLTYEIRMAVSPDRPALLAELNKAIALYPEVELDRLKAQYAPLVSREPVNAWWFYVLAGLVGVLLLWFAWRTYHSRKAQQQAEAFAQQDALTGAVNRHGMAHKIPHMLALADEGHLLSVVMFDLDHFKRVNDTYGHQVGDEVLKFLVQTVNQHLRNTDLLVRWGGEEFLLFCPGTALPQAVALAERLRQAVAEAFERSQWPNVTISLGVTVYHLDEMMTDTLSRVDALLYRAKHNGRNRVESDLTSQKEVQQHREHEADDNH